MKGKRFKLFILSVLLITICSGVLFYKNLYTLEPPRSALKVDFDELRTIDLQVNSTIFYLRQNLSADLSELNNEVSRINELIDILRDINRSSPELKTSVEKIDLYFREKQKKINTYLKALQELRDNVDAIGPAYGSLVKHNIKFVVDKRDFYRECMMDIYQYLAIPNRDNELRLLEDQKIISQVVNFSSSPNQNILRFSNLLDRIHKNVKTIDEIQNDFREESINPEMITVSKYYQESVEIRNRQNENFLKIIFVAIALYLAAMVFIIKR